MRLSTYWRVTVSLPEGCFADRQGTGHELDPAVTNDENQPISVPGKVDEPSLSSTEDHDETETTQEEELDPVDNEPTEVTPTAPLPDRRTPTTNTRKTPFTTFLEDFSS